MADGAMGYPGGLERRDFPVGTLPAMPAALRRISWGAVFAGLIVAVMVSLILSLLGMSIGLGTVNPMEEANPFGGLGLGAAIWWVVSSLIALFIGGWVAARMAGVPKRFDGALHGVLAWGLVTLLTFYFLTTTIGRLVGGVSSLVGQGLSMAGQGVASMAPEAAGQVQERLQEQGITLDALKEEAQVMLRQSGQPGLQPESLRSQARDARNQAEGAAATAAQDPQESEESLAQVMKRIADKGQGAASQADKDAAVNIIVARTGKSRAEASQMVDNWETSLRQSREKLSQTKEQAEAKARQYGQTAAAGMSKASLWTFIALLLSGVSAALGGAFGAPKDVVPATTRTIPPTQNRT